MKKIAFPTSGETIDSPIIGHFGHTPQFLLARLDDSGTFSDEIILLENRNHDSEGCFGLVSRIADSGVTDIVLGGIGARPFQALLQSGINVYKAKYPTVKENMDAFKQNDLAILGQSTCNSSQHHSHDH